MLLYFNLVLSTVILFTGRAKITLRVATKAAVASIIIFDGISSSSLWGPATRMEPLEHVAQMTAKLARVLGPETVGRS